MTYSLAFRESALKEWKKLDPPIRDLFKKKLAERLQRPCNLTYMIAMKRI